MPLIKCPDCGKSVSEHAEYCIHCGCPLDAKENKPKSKYLLNDEITSINVAVRLYKQQEDLNDIPDDLIYNALVFNTAKACFWGVEPTKQNYYRAYNYFSHLCFERGEMLAARYLGEMYEKGYYVKQDFSKAFDYYLKAATNFPNKEQGVANENPEFAMSKLKMYEMFVYHSECIPKELKENSYFCSIGFLLCAADDGNEQALKLLELEEEVMKKGNDDLNSVDDLIIPYTLLSKAKNGDTDAMFRLAKVYTTTFAYWYRWEYSEKWLRKGVENGSNDCLSYLIPFLCARDNYEYELSPNNYEIYYQTDIFKNFIKNYLSNENITKEVLVVNSAKRIDTFFDLIIKFIKSNPDKEHIYVAISWYMELVNKSNSYVRVKEGLPSNEIENDIKEEDLDDVEEFDESDEYNELEESEPDYDSSFDDEYLEEEARWEKEREEELSEYRQNYDNSRETGWYYSDDGDEEVDLHEIIDEDY